MDGNGFGAVGSETTTGRRLIPSVARIATCGWLITGTVK